MRLICNFSPHVSDQPILSLSKKQLRAVEHDILVDLCPVPQEWIDELTSLRKQEEAIIQKRKHLVISWCATYDTTIRDTLAALPTTHPEIYI